MTTLAPEMSYDAAMTQVFHCWVPFRRTALYDLSILGGIRAAHVRESVCADCLPQVNQLIEEFKAERQKEFRNAC